MNPTVSLDKLGIQTKADYEESQLVVDKGDDGLDRNAFLTLSHHATAEPEPSGSDGERSLCRAARAILAIGSDHADVHVP